MELETERDIAAEREGEKKKKERELTVGDKER